MATGKFTVSVNGVTIAEFENEIRLVTGQQLRLQPRFEVQDEELTITFPTPPSVILLPPLADSEIFGPALPRRENGKTSR